MSYIQHKHVRVVGMAATVPKETVSNMEINNSKDYDASAFVKATGVEERHRSEKYTTSDLCLQAAERLLADLGWAKEEIDGLIFVSQTHDYQLPATACILQNRLGLSRDTYAVDLSLGCSGWVYGMSVATALIGKQGLHKVLLCAGDAHLNEADPLFGDAGTVTALEYDEAAQDLLYHFGTDGEGYEAIIIPDGGMRNQVNAQSFVMEEIDGKLMNRLMIHMNGMDVFSFGISTAPKSVKQLAEHFGYDYLDADYYIFHQANMKMNNMIAKKLKLEESKVPSSMLHFGNTSSASIPLTIVTELAGKVEAQRTKWTCCGFGVGLSWGSLYMVTDKLVISPLIEVE